MSWPVFRGDAEFTGTAAGSLAPKLQLLWSTKVGGSVAGPVVGRGRIYVASGKVAALNPADGKILWLFTNEVSYSTSPVLAGNVLFVGADSGEVAAFDADKGTILWTNTVGGQITGSGNVLETKDRKIFFMGSHDNWMYAFDGATGALSWKFETGNFINGSPALVKEELVFGGCDATLHVVGAADGKERIAIPAGSYLGGSPGTSGGKVYVGHYEGSVVCADLGTGKIDWEFTTGEGKQTTFFSAPAIGGGKVVAGCRDGQVYCLSAKDGKKLWTFQSSGEIDMAAVICGDKTVFGTPDGKLHVVDLEKGTALWSYELGAVINDGPAVTGGKVFAGAGDGMVYAFGPAR
jgi:outer membrane protein assembly factor BamB